MLLTLRNIAKVFGTRVILRSITCAVDSGEIVLLVGANGAGKSTLLRIMAGLAQPTSGQCDCPTAPAEVAYVGHATFLYGGLTACENLAFWRDAQGLAGGDALLEAVLRRVELLPHAHERAGVFSRGMAQRLNLARMLMSEPKLILLDEPGTGLDAHSLALLRREIQSAAARGAGVVWISHDVPGDAPLAHRVWALDAGRLVYDGPARDFTGLEALRGDAPTSTVEAQPATNATQMEKNVPTANAASGADNAEAGL